MVGELGVGLDANHSRNREICLPPTAAGFVAGGAAGLVVHNPITDGCGSLVEVRLGKVVPYLGQIVVGRVDLGREHSLRHRGLHRSICGILSQFNRRRDAVAVPLSPDMIGRALPGVWRLRSTTHINSEGLT